SVRRLDRLRLEVREVVLLLQSGVAEDLLPHAVSGEPLERDRLRDDDSGRSAAPQLVLEPRELVVERGRARDPERAGGKRPVVRAVGEGDVEASRPGPAP